MRKGMAHVFAIIVSLVLTGCLSATRMPLHESTEVLDDAGGPLLLMTATIRNDFRPTFQPQLALVHVEKTTAKPRDNSREGKINFGVDDLAGLPAATPESGGQYLLRLRLPAGDYRICGLTSRYKVFPLIGTFFAPLQVAHTVEGTGVFYLGHVEAIVRERQGEEFRAGQVTPYIDQLTTGAAGGTFDISITDRFDTDEKAFRERFRQLAAVEIKKKVLAPFDRPAVQKWFGTPYTSRKTCVLPAAVMK